MSCSVSKKMKKFDMFKTCPCGPLANSTWLEQRVVNIPSSVKQQADEKK